MTKVVVNEVQLAYDVQGAGDIPLVMVHGSWLSRRTWEPLVPHLAKSCRVVTYDRRGHGDSERPSGQGSVLEDVDDLAALIEHLDLAPAWLAGQSFGGSITLRLAGERPDLLRGVSAHEPPLFALVADDAAVAPMLEGFADLVAAVSARIVEGDHAGAAEQFDEAGLGSALWTQLAPDFRRVMIENAPTFLDEAKNPDQVAFDLEWIAGFARPILLTQGDQIPPVFPPVITTLTDALPSTGVESISGAGHVVHVEQPEDYADAIIDFIRRHTT